MALIEGAKREKLAAAMAPATTWYAACETGHPFWSGPDETTFADAQTDATDHDNKVHGGTPTAVVLNN